PPDQNEEGKAQAYSRTDPHRSFPPRFRRAALRTHQQVRSGRANAPLQSWQRASAASLGAATAGSSGRRLRAPANTSRPRPMDGNAATLLLANSPTPPSFGQ